MLPTFIVAGASKSGTTAIWEHLRPHPEICMAWMKEPNFFTREGRQSGYHKGLAWYQSLFQACEGAKVIGDVSPAYMTKSDAPMLISQALPDVQLLFILRDPVERIYSQYRYALHRGRRFPDLQRMVKERHSGLAGAIHVSSYHLHLRRFLDTFPKEQVFVFVYDDWRSDARAFIQGIYRAIGVDANFTPSNLDQRYNPTQVARVAWGQRALGYLSPIVMRARLSPRLFAMLRDIRGALWRLNSRQAQVAPMPVELRRELIGELTETIEYVEAFLDRPLPSWREC